MLLNESLEAVIEKVSKEYTGDFTVLESAVGALVTGQLFGWKVLRMVHGSRTYARYEKILGLKFREVCPERTSLSSKSAAIKIADKVGDFWAIAKGEKPGRSPQVELDVPLDALLDS